MNILYVSNLSGKKSAGLSYSVPAQIRSQGKVDNVIWYNTSDTPKEQLINGSSCYNKEDFPNFKMNKLPFPSNKPDLVIFEGVYFFEYVKISKQCNALGIPYIIIPRGSLTNYAQKKKSMKKVVGNKLFFYKFIKNALAIQYLTENEYEDSGSKWNKRYLIIPNGIEHKENTKLHFNSTEDLIGIYIGRPDSYHKGIDLLLDACAQLKQELKKHNCKIKIFAPIPSTRKDDIQEMITNKSLDDIVFRFDGIYGSEKEKVILDSDFFILTSRFEGHPMGLIEALSYGLPCLVTKGTNMAEEIKAVNAGWTSDINTESIVNAFRSLFEERKLLQDKSKNAIELSRKYNWDHLAELSSNEYKELINS